MDRFSTIQETAFNPRESILMTSSEQERIRDDFIKGEINLPPEDFEGNAKILKYSPHQVEVVTRGNDSCFLVLADNYYPGWKVQVNGIEKSILRVNYNLRGVILPRGENKVRFSFNPLSFKIGASISLLTLCAVAAFFFMQRRFYNSQNRMPIQQCDKD